MHLLEDEGMLHDGTLLTFWTFVATIKFKIFGYVVQFKCDVLCLTVDEKWLYEICRSLQTVFVYILQSVPVLRL